jgi:hypothetical protein
MHTLPNSIPTQRSLNHKAFQFHNWKFQFFPKMTNSLKINDYVSILCKTPLKKFSKFKKILDFIGCHLWKIWKNDIFPNFFQIEKHSTNFPCLISPITYPFLGTNFPLTNFFFPVITNMALIMNLNSKKGVKL